MYKFLTIFTFLCYTTLSFGFDHWETVIYNNDTWRYKSGAIEPPADWMQPTFDYSTWSTGIGGFGYGDDDDNTQISNTLSFYMRKEFDLVDTSVIEHMILHADYDDAFVAYLNGVEIARNNIGEVGIPPVYNAVPYGEHEAMLYLGLVPESYMISGETLKNLMKEGVNTFAVQTHNIEIGSSDFTSNFFLSFSIEDTSMNYGPTPDWFTSPFFDSNLPLIIINTTETTEIYDEPRVPAHMGIIDNGPGQTNSVFDSYNEYDGRIFIEIRGASSQMFPKKNYGFETQLADGSNNNVSLLGMPEENDWVLHGPYPDKSLLRNVLAYHMGRSTGRYAPRTRLCELLVNGDYRGVYMFTERIKVDENRVDIAKVKPEDISGDELTGGYIFQIDRDNPDVPNDGWESNYPDNKFFAFDQPDYDDIMQPQRSYLMNYVNEFESKMNGANYATDYLNYVDVDSWVDYFLVTEIGKHIDAFKLSFYMQKRKESNGGKIHFGPLWDFNLGFGNFDFACPPHPEGWAYLFRGSCDNWHPFWARKLAEIPNVSHQTNCRWQELREGPLRTDSLIQFIDEKVMLLNGGAQQRNFDRWPVLGEYVWPNNFVGQSYIEEIGFLKSWLIERLSWMDDNMIGDCNLWNEINETSMGLPIGIYPNPAGDDLFVSFGENEINNVTLRLYDLLGGELKVFNNVKSNGRVSLKGLVDGMYVYRLNDEEGRLWSGKLVKVGE